MNAEIISVGTELLLGKVVNIDTTIIARELSAIGVNLLYAVTIGDNPKRLEEAVKTALERSDILITTGGLGPTADDLTKEIVAQTAGKKLVMFEDCKAKLIAQFPVGMTENQLKQAVLPENCHVLTNDNGTAPGCAFESANGKLVMMFPGPPSELEPMLKNYAIPYLLKDEKSVIVSHNVRIYGKGEAPVAEMIDDLIDGENPTVAPYANEGECYMRVTAKASSEEEADRLCMPLVDEIVNRVGDFVYTTKYESIEETIVNMLAQEGKTIATAESCTGGFLAKRITDISGSSKVFETGVIAYANKTKTKLLGVSEEILEKHGAVSEECATAMAQGIVKLSGANIGVAITGIAGPEGGTKEKPVGLIYIAISDGEKTFVSIRNSFSRNKDRTWHRYVAATHALDMVRRYLQGIDVCKVNPVTLSNKK